MGGLSPRHARLAAIAAVVVLVALIVDNVRWQLVIDDTRPASERLIRRSRNLRKVAALEYNVAISGRLAAYYKLAHAIGGATLVVPEQLAGLTWMLERVGRLHVVVEASALRVDASRLELLRRAAPIHEKWYVRGRSKHNRVIRSIHIDPGTRDEEYVLGTTPRDEELFVIPRSEYEANKDGVGPVAP